jgi:predicted GNAT superfamily acetyltransferase
MALLALAEGGKQLVGLVLFGTVAGARSVVKVHGIVARERDVAVALLDAVRQASERSGERMIVSELPDDTPFALASEALEASGFAEEGRVPDFVRDGVALRLFVRPLLTV